MPGRNGRPPVEHRKSLDLSSPCRNDAVVAVGSLLDEFAQTGVVRLHDVFSDADAEAMREVVWKDLEYTDGVKRDTPSTWHRSSPRRRLHRAKRHPIFHRMIGPQLHDIADALLGPGWDVSGGFGNLLVDFRDSDRWHLPGSDGHWHLDTRWDEAADRLSGLRIFALFGEIPPGGGGTLLVAGSPHLIERHIASRPGETDDGLQATDVAGLLFASHPWLWELTTADPLVDPHDEYESARRSRFMDSPTDIDGKPAQVIEACGKPGDVYVCHPWTIHCRPPIASDGPRFLRSPTLFAAPRGLDQRRTGVDELPT